MLSGLKTVFMGGLERGRKWYRNRVANAATVVNKYYKYKEHGHQFTEGVKKELGRTKHTIRKAKITGARDAIVYNTENKIDAWGKRHKVNNKKNLTIRVNTIHKREQEIRDARKAALQAKAEEKIRREKEAETRKAEIKKAAEKQKVVNAKKKITATGKNALNWLFTKPKVKRVAAKKKKVAATATKPNARRIVTRIEYIPVNTPVAKKKIKPAMKRATKAKQIKHWWIG